MESEHISLWKENSFFHNYWVTQLHFFSYWIYLMKFQKFCLHSHHLGLTECTSSDFLISIEQLCWSVRNLQVYSTLVKKKQKPCKVNLTRPHSLQPRGTRQHLRHYTSFQPPIRAKLRQISGQKNFTTTHWYKIFLIISFSYVTDDFYKLKQLSLSVTQAGQNREDFVVKPSWKIIISSLTQDILKNMVEAMERSQHSQTLMKIDHLRYIHKIWYITLNTFIATYALALTDGRIRMPTKLVFQEENICI